jgi:hypothetical protein
MAKMSVEIASIEMSQPLLAQVEEWLSSLLEPPWLGAVFLGQKMERPRLRRAWHLDFRRARGEDAL